MAGATDILRDAMALFAIIDPVGSIAIFLSLTHSQTDDQKRKTANLAVFSMVTILVITLLVGEKFLWFFGISISSFQVGGGILIFLLAVSMLNARMPEIKRTEEEAKEAEQSDAVAVVPLAIPLMAGPGAISSVIINSHNSASASDYAVHIVIIILIGLFALLVFRSAVPIARKLGATGQNIITRIMGLLLSAISVEIIANGLKGLFPVLV
jgi:multiple antibiotic resistance protein